MIVRSLDRVFVFEFVKCLYIGAPSKDPARFVDLGFGIFEKQEEQEYKRVPKKQTTTRSRCVDFSADLAKQGRKNSRGGFEVSKNDFCVDFFFWCVFLFVLIYSFHGMEPGSPAHQPEERGMD